jgi:hypothetical protein
MNEASQWRFAFAQRIAASYARNPKVRAIQVAGSVGRGTADRYSDLEIDIYYADAPTVAERVAAVEGCGATLESIDEDEDEWEEQMVLDGVHAATSTFLISTLERYLLEVVDEAQIAPTAQTRLYSLQKAIPILGHELVAQWQAKADAYPPQLTHAMLAANLPFRGFWYAEEMLAARQDVLLLYRSFIEVGRQMIGALLGLNRRYLLKWMHETLADLAIKPDGCASRITSAFRVEPVVGVRILKELIDDILTLVETHVPDFDTNPYRANFQRQRQALDGPPQTGTIGPNGAFCRW